MGRFQPFNDLPAAQIEALKKDVEARGIVNPILVDENDKTIDGHQRRRVAAELGIECPRIVLEGLSDDEKMSLAIALNTFRRHLTGTERAKALQQMALLGMSTRRIAEATGLSQRTVVRGLHSGESYDSPDPVRQVDAETGEILSGSTSVEQGPSSETPKLDAKVVGKDGKSYPAAKPKPALTADEQAAEDRKGQLRRAAHRLEQFATGWIEFEDFYENPDRDEILALLIEPDREVILEIEARFMIGARA